MQKTLVYLLMCWCKVGLLGTECTNLDICHPVLNECYHLSVPSSLLQNTPQTLTIALDTITHMSSHEGAQPPCLEIMPSPLCARDCPA